jgi:hypothetical protein
MHRDATTANESRAALCLLLALAAALIVALATLAATVLRALLTELADEVRASRNETTVRSGGIMSTRNIRLYDSTTALRAANARLAAYVGDTSEARATLSDARQLAAELAMPVRRAL